MRTAEDGINDALIVIEAHPEGISAKAISKLIGLGPDSTCEKLRRLRDRGQANATRQGGINAVWMTWERAEAARAAYASQARSKAAEAEDRRRDRKRSIAAQERAQAEAEQAAILDAFEADPEHLLIPAGAWKATIPAGPRWVFDGRI